MPGAGAGSVGEAAADLQYLTRNVVGFGQAEEQDAARGLMSGSGAAERDALLDRLDHGAGEADAPRRAVDHDDGFARNFLCQSRLDIAESDAIDVDRQGPPFLRQRARESVQASLG